jgi:hypothetical protein
MQDENYYNYDAFCRNILNNELSIRFIIGIANYLGGLLAQHIGQSNSFNG